MVRVIGQRVLACLLILVQIIFATSSVEAVGLCFAYGGLFLILCAWQHLSVADAPVVLVGALSPSLAELLFSLFDHVGIIEVPCTFLTSAGIHSCVLLWTLCSGGSIVASRGVVVGGGSVACSLLLLLFLLLLQGLYDSVYGSRIFRFAHLGQGLQAVLQFDGTQMRLQFAQDFASPFGLLIFVVLLVQDAHTALVGTCGIDIVFLLPVHLAQSEQEHGFRWSALGGFLHAFLPGRQAACCILHSQIDVSHGVIHLVQIVLVLVTLGHSLQPGNHLAELAFGHDFCLQDAGIE